MKKTKVLLIFPPLIVDPSDYPSPDPPLGLAYLAVVLEQHKFPVKILDALALGIETAKRKKGGFLKVGLSKKEIKKVVAEFKPKLVGISCGSTANAPDSHEVASWVKEVDPKILVVFGGAHATACAPLVLSDPNVDVVVMGEGEMTFLELAERLENKKDVGSVLGTCQRKNSKVITNPRQDYIMNLDDLPDPARHLLPMGIYLKRQTKTREFSMRTPRTNIVTSRGCPGNCIFCSIHAIWGHCWRPRSPERVVTEVEHLVKAYGVREFYVLDDSISIDKKRLMEICDLICKKGLDIKWAAPNGIAIWTLDKEVLAEMKKSGFYRITFGIESGCPRTLKFIRKPVISRKAKEIIALCNNLGLWTHSTFIIGFPDETREDIEETINWAVNSGLDFATFYIATPYPGTDLRQEFIKRSLLKEEEGEDKMHYSSINVAGYNTCHFTKEELNRLRDEAYSRFFAAQVKRFLNPFYAVPHLARKMHYVEELRYFFRILNNALGMKIQSLFTGKFQTHHK